MKLFVTINIMILLLGSLVFINVSTDPGPYTNTKLLEELAGVMS